MPDPTPELIYQLMIFSFVSYLVLIGLVIYFLYGTQKRHLAHCKNVEELKMRQENALLQAQLEMQEQTFANISGEIHDNIGQKLTLAKLHLNTLPLNGSVQLQGQVNQSIQMIGEVIADLSDMSRSMSSEILLQNGLIKAIEFEVGQIAKTGLFEISSRVTGDPVFLPSSTELVLFRIVQEALHNIIKHASATRIFIELDYSSNKLGLVVRDNGLGFNVDANNARGIGLANMHKRAKMIDASFNIETARGEGTVISLQKNLYE